MKRIKIIVTLMCFAMIASSCSGKPADNAQVNETTTTTAAAVTTAAAATTTAAVTAEVNADMSETVTVPSITEDPGADFPTASKRGSGNVSCIEDDKADNGKALMISGRKEGWSGAQYDCELFRGNEVEVIGSFRSSNASVRVSVQYTVLGNTLYNMVFSVNTKDDKYSKGKGKYTIPANAENILIYIESDTLDDIYVDNFSINVCGDYTYYAEPAETVFADTSEYESLKEVYSDLFRIGCAVSPTIIKKPAYSELIKAQFNSITAENDMKPEGLLDKATTLSDIDTYRDAPALKFKHLSTELGFAKKNGMTVRGHTLVWHSQTPEWLFYKDYEVGGELADRELMLRRMENYIKGVMEWTDANYPGLISAWDVVNEAADDKNGMRQSLWYKTVGEDFVARAFEFARKYAPEGVKLFYNDYNSYQKRKQEDILGFLKPVAEAGNIDGVGMQSHIGTYTNIDEYMNALQRYVSELGVEIQITELDIEAPKSDGWEEVQGEYYANFMNRIIGLRKSGVPITSLTLWGINDNFSWKASDRPLLFREDLSAKPAFYAMVNAPKADIS